MNHLTRFRRLLAVLGPAVLWLLLLCPGAVRAHTLPQSRLDLHIDSTQMTATLDLPLSGITKEFPDVESASITDKTKALSAFALSRLHICPNGEQLSFATAAPAELLPPEGKMVRLHLIASTTEAAKTLRIWGCLFPAESNNETLVIVREASSGDVLHQAILTTSIPEVRVGLRGEERQSALAVLAQFIREGVHHIAIGPDHILFILGLLLLGGGAFRLLKVVTAFTVAHSITLALAALGLVTLPASFVEPVIAASIVVVGIHGLFRLCNKSPRRDGTAVTGPEERLFYAFGFGLIHGFGFAGAMADMSLPRHALGLALFGFNVGVEIGQLCLVLTVAPLLTLLARRSPTWGRRVVIALTLVVIAAGAYWFGQRV